MARKVLVVQRVALVLLQQSCYCFYACNWLDSYISDTNDLPFTFAICVIQFDANLTIALEQGRSPMLRQSLPI